MLARREHGRRELARKLRLRGYAQQEIDGLLDALEADNLLDDNRYVSVFIRSRALRGMGPLKIAGELQKQGLDRHVIQSNATWQEMAFPQRALSARIKRFGEGYPQNAAEVAQQRRFLTQRGFEQAQIDYAMHYDKIEPQD